MIGRGRQGQALVEFVLVLPLLLMLIIASVEFGRLMSDLTIMRNVAYEAARAAAVGHSDDELRQLAQKSASVMMPNAGNRAESYATDPDSGKRVYHVRFSDDGDDEWVELSVNPAHDDRVQGNPITIQVVLGFKPIFTGWIMRDPLAFQTTAVSRTE